MAAKKRLANKRAQCIVLIAFPPVTSIVPNWHVAICRLLGSLIACAECFSRDNYIAFRPNYPKSWRKSQVWPKGGVSVHGAGAGARQVVFGLLADFRSLSCHGGRALGLVGYNGAKVELGESRGLRGAIGVVNG